MESNCGLTTSEKIIDLLVKLLADQEKVKVTYTIKKGQSNEERGIE